MNPEFLSDQLLRDGTSQNRRSPAALSFEYFAVEERTPADLLDFARAFAGELTYFNERNEPDGDWSAFFAGDSGAIASALEAIDSDRAALDRFPAEIRDRLSSPHFALFLTFLQLLDYPKRQFQQLTKRRLDFYYREVLRLAEKTATPDRVHLVFSPAPERIPYLLKAGTLLSAGEDALGQPLQYATDTDLYINKARVASVKTLSFDTVSFSLREIHQPGGNPTDEGFEEMLRWVLGFPERGDPFPRFGDRDMNLDSLIGLFREIQREPTTGKLTASWETSVYILDRLVFCSLQDFYTCFEVYERQAGGTSQPTDEDWNQVYQLLEKAFHKRIDRQSRERGSNYPPIDRVEKRAIRVRSLPDRTDKPERFSPFSIETSSGEIQKLGIAIASPVLHLREGTREIALTLSYKPGTFPPVSVPLFPSNEPIFNLRISTEKGWLAIPPANIVNSSLSTDSLRFTLTLDATRPAITAPPADGSIDFPGTDPVIQILLNDKPRSTSDKTAYYQLFRDLELVTVKIEVTVTGLRDLQLRDDRSPLDPKAPFEPFGSRPIAGAGFYFAHPEIVSKKLDELSLTFDWMGLPDNFADYYSAYSRVNLSPSLNTDSFTARLQFFINRTGRAIAGGNARSLFSETVDSSNPAKTKLQSSRTLQYSGNDFSEIPDDIGKIPAETSTDDLLESDRYFRLELNAPDFQHEMYPLVLNAVARSTDDGIKNLKVYPPYDPKVKSISLDYKASAEIHLPAAKNRINSGKVFQLHPFGYVELPRMIIENNISTPRSFFLARYDEEGSLYIGLRDLEPPGILTLLFHAIAGSGIADLDPPEIRWSYLDAEGWQDFPADRLLADSTNGLLDSGITRFDIQATASDRNPLMPKGFYWLRAEADKNPTAIPDFLVDIRAQVVSATLVDRGNDPARLGKPLVAGTIRSLVESAPAIVAVEQPYSSFGGRPRETDRAFYTRVSERLRHKQRALTRWDYERLVLEKFPSVYKVKCLTRAEQDFDPGAAIVTVVVIPDLANTAPFFPLEPKVPRYLLREIEIYLQARVSPWVKVIAKNPRYERIQYRFDVRFIAGVDRGYRLQELNRELVEFLSPWAYEKQSDISFGSSIAISTVVYFLESRPYVEYVANLKLIEYGSNSEENDWKSGEGGRVSETGTARVKRSDSILVSVPEHIIGIIDTTDYRKEAFEGIGYMIVEIDFVVA